MARMTKREQYRAYVEQWRRAGPELERIRREELRAYRYDSKDAETLLEIADDYDGPPRLTSGLVEMQSGFMKFAQKKRLLPARVREELVSYDVGGVANILSAKNADQRFATPLHSLGKRDLLKNKWTAFFCSVRCPGNLILKAYDLAQRWRAENQPVIGGFHSPVEKEVLKIMLRSTVPVSAVLARSLPKRIPTEFRHPLDEGRLLLVSPFGVKMRHATRETAAHRNQVVAALADKVFVAYAASGGKTEAFCREVVGTGKTCMTFDDPKTANLKAAGFASLLL
jgi:hypothetical protein